MDKRIAFLVRIFFLTLLLVPVHAALYGVDGPVSGRQEASLAEAPESLNQSGQDGDVDARHGGENIIAGLAEDESKIWIEEQTGSILPLDLAFTDENAQQVRLGDLIDKPTLLLPIYFYCPNSCPLNLVNMAMALKRMKLQAGQDYRAIALSFNTRDTPADARSAKQNYLKLLDDSFPAEQWNFLTGSEENIKAVLETIGYTYKELDDGTFIHPSVLVALGKDGMLIKYVYGTFTPGDVEIALVEAERGTPALSIKRLLNYCFNYDPDANKTVFDVVKVIALVLFGGLGLLFVVFFLRKKQSGGSGNSNLQHG